jgi:hypothetical protein
VEQLCCCLNSLFDIDLMPGYRTITATLKFITFLQKSGSPGAGIDKLCNLLSLDIEFNIIA